ncbi:MAG: biotin--[acetyl-CoA-carboxylase] ligase [Dongiaceae bacterium]
MTAAAPGLPSFYRLVAFDCIDSTNEEGRRQAAAGAVEGTLLWAREQLAGRGRRGRSWQSPPGNLYVSLVLRPPCAPATAAQLSFVAAVGLGAALDGLLPVGTRVQYKWPNDVLVGGRKVAGILLETAASPGPALDWLVVGVGVNVESCPDDAPFPATSLGAAGAGEASVAGVLEAFARHFLDRYRQWRAEGFAPIRAGWLDGARGLGQPVEARLEGETLAGRFATLDEGGGLVLDLPGGGRRTIAAGEVFYPGL